MLSFVNAIYGDDNPLRKLNHEMALRERMKQAYLSPLTGSVLVNESTPPLRDQHRYLTGSSVTELAPNTKPNSVVDTEGELNE